MRIWCVFVIAAAAFLPADALAQQRRGASVSAIVAAATVDSSTEPSFAAAFDYHFSRVVGFEVEATVVPKLRAPFPSGPYSILADASSRASILPLIYPSPRLENPDGRLVIVSNNVRIAVPTTSDRLEPYFAAGGGIASTRRTANYVYPAIDPRVLADLTGLFGPVQMPGAPGFSYPVTTSSVEMALTIGGGVSVRVRREMSIDADLRMFRLLGDEDRSVGRFGVGVRYRF